MTGTGPIFPEGALKTESDDIVSELGSFELPAVLGAANGSISPAGDQEQSIGDGYPSRLDTADETCFLVKKRQVDRERGARALVKSQNRITGEMKSSVNNTQN